MLHEEYLKPKWTTFIAIVIGVVIYGYVGCIGITIAPRIQIRPAIYFLIIYSALFGPVAGFFVGFLGHVITDHLLNYGHWWFWELSSGILGFCSGLICLFKDFNLKEGKYNVRHIQMFTLFTIYGILLGYFLAGAVDILIIQQSIMLVMEQLFLIMGINILILFFFCIPTIILILRHNKRKYLLHDQKSCKF